MAGDKWLGAPWDLAVHHEATGEVTPVWPVHVASCTATVTLTRTPGRDAEDHELLATVEVDLTIEVPARAVKDGHTTGYLLLDLVPDPAKAIIAGRDIPYGEEDIVGLEGRARVLKVEVPLKSDTDPTFELRVEYEGPLRSAGEVRHPDPQQKVKGLYLPMLMTDARPRGFLEQWLPCSLMFDEIDKLTVTVESPDVQIVRRSVYHNADSLTFPGGGRKKRVARLELEWTQVRSCDPFLHIEPFLDECKLPAAGAAPRVRVFGRPKRRERGGTRVRNELARAARRVQQEYRVLHEEIEAHPINMPKNEDLELLVHWTTDFPSMEHRRALRASDATLVHELAHLWVGRGLYPTTEQFGWIDEGFAALAAGGQHADDAPPFFYERRGKHFRSTARRAYLEGPRALWTICGRPGSLLRGVYSQLEKLADGDKLDRETIKGRKREEWGIAVRPLRERRRRRRFGGHKERGGAATGFSTLKLMAGHEAMRHGGAGAQIWPGTIFVYQGGQLVTVGYRTIPEPYMGLLYVTEFWAHLPGYRLNPEPGDDPITMETRHEPDSPTSNSYNDFVTWAADALDEPAGDLEIFEHRVRPGRFDWPC